MKVTATLASHNRWEKTLACLGSYFAQERAPGIELEAVLVDDGSTDGTAGTVRGRFERVEVIEGDGTLFWAGAMAIAEEAALCGDPDYLLWLNDDVILDPAALGQLIDVASATGEPSIAVGALRDPESGRVTYSGVRRTGLHPLRFERITPGDLPVPVETFNGNVVLVPRAVTDVVGGLDGDFVHAGADFDYGLRAADAGVRNVLAPGTVGTCPPNPRCQPWLDRSMPIHKRVGALLGPKGAPPRARARFLRRHGGPAWPIFWLGAYARAISEMARSNRADPAR
jgi:GT2 family glycosyltransferase